MFARIKICVIKYWFKCNKHILKVICMDHCTEWIQHIDCTENWQMNLGGTWDVMLQEHVCNKMSEFGNDEGKEKYVERYNEKTRRIGGHL